MAWGNGMKHGRHTGMERGVLVLDDAGRQAALQGIGREDGEAPWTGRWQHRRASIGQGGGTIWDHLGR